jgi:hypothetical protein
VILSRTARSAAASGGLRSLTRSLTRTECRPCDQGRFLGLRQAYSLPQAVAASAAFRYLNPHAPVAQLDRALPSEGRGQGFESLRARQGSRKGPSFLNKVNFECLQSAQSASSGTYPNFLPHRSAPSCERTQSEIALGQFSCP